MKIKENVKVTKETFEEDLNFEYFLSKYGNECVFELGKLLQEYAYKDAFKAIEESLNIKR